MSTFKFNKVNPIILYGAAAIGSIMFEKLTANGFCIKGFFDKRANEISMFNRLPVWDIRSELPIDKNKTIIIVSVKNVFEHEKIATDLLQQGYQNLIFKSRKVLNGKGSDDQLKLSSIYDDILFEQTLFDQVLPKTKNTEIYDLKDYALVKEEDEFVIVKIPCEFVYTNNYDSSISKWGNICILNFFTHLDFFRMLNGNVNCTDEYYLNDYCIYTAPDSVSVTEGWKKNVINNRAMIFEKMNLSSELDIDFFYRNPCEAIWNETGFFNLTSGKHRASFFASKKYKFIPLKISKEDYTKFLNEKIAAKLYDYLKNSHIHNLSVPIPHPYFYLYPTITNEFYSNLLSFISDQLSKKIYRDEKVLKFSEVVFFEKVDGCGYISRHLKRMGCDGYVIRHDDELQKLMDSLLHIKNIKYIDTLQEIEDRIDIVILETNYESEVANLLDLLKPKFIVLITKNRNVNVDCNYIASDPHIQAYKNNEKVRIIFYSKKEV